MNDNTVYVDRPLYHGTSSHYISMFKPGTPPSYWPYTEVALKLLRQTWEELKRCGETPDWYVDHVLKQDSGNSNWQHGQLYLTPSRGAALRYACSGASKGGELLTFCADALNKLADHDADLTEYLIESSCSVQTFLRNDGHPPLIIQFDSIRVADLLPERADDDPLAMLTELESFEPKKREIFGQQHNFRLANGAGRIVHVFELELQGEDWQSGPYRWNEVHASRSWS